MSQLLLIPVPGSGDDGAPVVRVVVVPKLDAADGIAMTGMANWPDVVASARFDLELAPGQQTIEGVEPRAEADPEVWRSFFGAVRVDAAPPPAVGGPDPVVTPTSEQVADVEATYRNVAEVEIDVESAAQPELDAAVAKELSKHLVPDAEPELPPPPAVAPAEQEPDFHRILALLREHPPVLRALGLVFDLPIDSAALAEKGTVRVRWPQPPAELATVVSPRTAYEVNEDRGFLPASTATIKAGLVDLADEDAWATTTLDVDNATGRLRDAARTVESSDQPGRLPALRSAGIGLLRRGRERDFAARRSAAAANAERESLEDAPPLTADDLVLGLRVDVRFKGSETWSSLCRREARYTVDGREVLPASEEEGHVKAGASVRRAGDVLRADEIVTRWNGWSLVVPQAGPGRRARAGRAAPLPFDFKWDFAVPSGSLLPLRFGRDYHLRARVADLAGGGVPRGDLDVALGTRPIPYVRYEPVASPIFGFPDELDPRDLGPGGTMEHLVIRTDAPDYPRNDERVVAPPTTTLDVAEQHGELDGADEVTLERVERALAGRLPDPASEGVNVFRRPEPGRPPEPDHPLGWRGEWPDAEAKRLKLRPKTAAVGTAAVRPSGNDIHVVLAPAEQVTLELSSFLKDDFVDHLALQQWRSSAAPIQVVKNGRHPMATPARVVTLVHAVRRPLRDPRGALTPQQVPGGTSATLVPSEPMLGIDAASTIELQVTASFADMDDDRPLEVVDAPVGNLAVERGDQNLRGPLVHELGTTRHRMIRYRLTAVSRFRHLFRGNEDDELFVARTELDPVSIKSTVRPPVPAVRAVVPAFRWEDLSDGGLVRRRRAGGRLRVELLRPWHVSGVGEQLAVLVEQTEVGRDPIWDTADLERTPPPSAYLPLEGQASVALPDGVQVTVVPYDVQFETDHWFADVTLPPVAETSYRPFVRLALARYQRESLAGSELSPPVRTELVQLLPDRMLTVDPSSPDAVVVKVDGRGPSGPNPNRVDVILEHSDKPDIDLTALDNPEGGLAAWTKVAQASGALGERIEVKPRPSGTLRVRVREVEILADQGAPPPSEAGTPGELTERVVFTDVVSLP